MVPLSEKTKYALILLIGSFLLHFIQLSSPRSIVFDEMHFGKFISAYWSHKNIFDVHPPHSKLLIAAVAKVGGYDGTFDFDHIGEDYKDVPIFWLRALPALIGSFLPLLIFLLLLELGASSMAAFLGGLCLLFDNAFLLGTRLMLIDGLLLFSTMAFLYFFLRAERAIGWKSRIFGFIVSGIFIGLAVGTKFTGLVAPMLLLLICLERVLKQQNIQQIVFSARAFLWSTFAALFTYLLGWKIHFWLLDQPGQGDAFFRPRGEFFSDLVKMHRQMLMKNLGMIEPHPYGSHWWQWPFMHKPLYYWSSETADIYFIGNPVVWWLGSLLFVVLVTNLVLRKISSLRFSATDTSRSLLWIPVAGFFISYLPYSPIERPLFIYHYLPPLIFIWISLSLWFDQIEWIRPGGFLKQRASFSIFVAFLVLGFSAMAPLTYGWPKAWKWSHLLLDAFPQWR